MKRSDPLSDPYPWASLVGESCRHGLESLVAAARPNLRADTDGLEEEEREAASNLVALDRLLLAAAVEAHGQGMCRECFVLEGRRAHFYASEFRAPDDELEAERIAAANARPCGCPAAEDLPRMIQVVSVLRAAGDSD